MKKKIIFFCGGNIKNMKALNRCCRVKEKVATVQRRKWSPTANDPQTGNDPQIGPQMIPNRKWSPMWTANDPAGK